MEDFLSSLPLLKASSGAYLPFQRRSVVFSSQTARLVEDSTWSVAQMVHATKKDASLLLVLASSTFHTSGSTTEKEKSYSFVKV